MAHPSHRALGVGWRVAHVVVLFAVLSGDGIAADLHFPTPLHLTRRIEDPISKTTVTLEEYCAGNRVVTVRGERVVIADYDRNEVTEIDRAAGTYSVTRFDEIARVSAKNTPIRDTKTTQAAPLVVSLGTRVAETGRAAELFEISVRDETVQLGVDRSIVLTRAAVDVLLGAAYPSRPPAHHEDLLRAAGPGHTGGPRSQSEKPGPETYGLPVEQATTFHFEGQSITLRNVITRVGVERAPPELIAIPPGAVRVESRITAAARLPDDLDRRPPRN